MKVLSIDFDYFQNVTEEQLALYPDGVDNSTVLSEFVWGNYYIDTNSQIKDVGILDDELEVLKRILLSLDRDCPVMIANSHKHIYNFVCERHKANEPLSVVNVDMHPDITNDNSELDCGNWVSHLVQRQYKTGEKMEFRWVTNPVSMSAFRADTPDFAEFAEFKGLLTSLTEIEGKKFDTVFLCRSDTWTPPHLDKYFTELCDLAKGYFNKIIIEKGIDKPRTQYLEIAKETANFIRNNVKHFLPNNIER